MVDRLMPSLLALSQRLQILGFFLEPPLDFSQNHSRILSIFAILDALS